MKVLEYLKQLYEVWRDGRVINDIATDNRPTVKKQKDYIYGEDILLPESNSSKRIKSPPFEPLDQQRTSACGAYAATHDRKLRTKEDNFPLAWYRARSNYPGAGMFIKDVIEMSARGIVKPTPANLPPVLNETFANHLFKQEVFGEMTEDTQYFLIKRYDADAVFRAVGQGHSVIVSFYSTLREWDYEMYPQDTVWPSTARVRHYVVALPNSVHTKDGQDWITVIDSSRYNNMYLRHIRKDFLEQRMYIGGAFVTKVRTKKSKAKELPVFRCQFGQRNDDVLTLQKYLVTQGLMEERHTTSYYGRITSAAVLNWQLSNIPDVNPAELIALEGKWWGPLSVDAVKIKHS